MGLGRAVLGKCAEDWDENDGPVRRDGRVFYRSTEATSKTIHTLFGQVTFSRSLYRSPGSPSFSPVDESLGLQLSHGSGGVQRSHTPVPLHAEGRGRNLRKVGGHGPVVELPQASVDEGGQALEVEGGGHGRYPRGGNWRSGVLRRLA